MLMDKIWQRLSSISPIRKDPWSGPVWIKAVTVGFIIGWVLDIPLEVRVLPQQSALVNTILNFSLAGTVALLIYLTVARLVLPQLRSGSGTDPQ